MLKMAAQSKMFLEKHLPAALSAKTINEALDLLFDLIDDKGFAPPHYDEYNDFGREAQRVYDDLYYQNSTENAAPAE